MPAFEEYLAAAEAEGVRIEPMANALRLDRPADGRLVLTCEREGQELVLEASSVIAAPGRRVEADLLESLELPVAKGRLKADRNTLATGLEGVFAAGECVSGPTAGVRAVAAGRLAALSIHQYLDGLAPAGEAKPINVRMGKLTDGQKAVIFRGVEPHPRVRQPTTGLARRRVTFEEVDRGLLRDAAVHEAQRCLQCDCAARDDCKLRRYATDYGAKPAGFAGERRPFERDDTHPDLVYESGKCILCELCVRLSEQAGEPLGMSLTHRGFVTRAGVPFGDALAAALTVSPEQYVAACPTGALALRRRAAPAKDKATALPGPRPGLRVTR